jgi:gliding motility-associated-like protein
LNKNLAYRIVLLISFFLISFSSSATHVVGGGITYTQLDNNNYLLSVRLYRDCSPGTANIPNNINVQCRRGDGTNPTIPNFNLPLISSNVINPTIPACVFDPGICVEEALYQAIINLPNGVGGYHLYYTICCRNATIQNITNPLNANETFYAYVPDNGIHPINSSPTFAAIPPTYVCAGQDLNLNFGATDPDGDVLVYSFYTPYDGTNNGGINYGAGAPPNNINISTVNWVAGFGATDPLDPAPGLLPGLTISPTGIINGTPTVPGQYVVGVMIDEYRNGVLIGRITRDFQFNVINCPPPITPAIDIVSNCDGLNVDFINNSGAGATNFWWDFGTGNQADSSVLFEPSFTYAIAGTYSVQLIVQKGTNCADTADYIFSIMDPVQFNLTVDSISCNGLSDGSASTSAFDPYYAYLWSTTQTGNSISNLTPASYWVHATNAIGCVDTQYFNVFEPTPLSVQFQNTAPMCYGNSDGSITAQGQGGTFPYTYYWPNQAFNGNPLQNIVAGNYPVQVTDANGCTSGGQSNLTQPQALNTFVSSQTSASCFGSSDGSVTVGVQGGVASYTIDWLTLPNDAFFMDNLAAGSYVAEITDANGCLSTLVVDILQPDTFYVDLYIINQETCSNGNGVAFADVTNGVGNISYLWNPSGQTTPTATGLTAGPLSVSVQDENGCTGGANAILIDNPTGIASVGNSSPVSCLNGADGMVEVLMNGGAAPFQYNWSCNCPNQNILNNLSAGNYTVQVTDANGCLSDLAFSVNELPALTVDTITVQSPTCNGFSDGFIEVAGAGGTNPYQYQWNTNPGQSNALATNLPQGNYQVSITDANGCVNVMDVVLSEPSQLIANAQATGNNLCFGDSLGVATVTASGGTGPYTYYWQETQETTMSIDSIPAGIYNAVVTDASGCVATDTTRIIEYSQVQAAIISDALFCPGDVVNFYVSTNGLNNQYTYNWYVNQTLAGTSNSLATVINDTSEISIVLVNTGNCPNVEDTVTVGPIMMLPNTVDITGTPDTICAGSSASLQGFILDPTYVSTYYWNNPNFIGLGAHLVIPTSATTYYLTAQNICGEQQTDSITINVFEKPAAYVIANGTEGCEEVNVSFTYGHDPSIYQLNQVNWMINNVAYAENEPQVNFNFNGPVQAQLALTFSNGCTFNYTDYVELIVHENPIADFYFNPDPALQNEITEFVDISKGNPKEWEWWFEGQLFATEERPSHVFDETGWYEVMQVITNQYGCVDSMIHQVEVIGSYTVFVPNAFTPDGNGHNNSFKPIMRDVTAENYQFLIFDRWGEIIYRTDDLEGEWDGNFQGDNARDGVYIWKIFVTDNVGKKHELMGHVTLLR